MKALPRKTLASILSGSTGDAAASSSTQTYSRAYLLRAFVDVCMAVALAHKEKILHRDLKPANIAIGDYGEVYVLDWGVARILGDDHPDTLDGVVRVPDDIDVPRVTTDTPSDDWPLSGESPPTRPGAILGTPGYMSPEQLRADPNIGPTADVYALGCILFEILAGQPLHARSGPLASTAMGADARPSRRAIAAGRDVSPELDAVCVRATAQRPEDRYPSAIELADAVQRYLDGDRDIARRRELAGQHVTDARKALAAPGDDGRRDAIRLAGAALALDPESAEAARLLGHLVVTAPTEMPEELRRDLTDKLLAEGRAHSKLATMGIATYYAFLPMFLWIGVTDWTWLAITYAVVTAATVFTIVSFATPRPRPWRTWATMVANAVIVALFARLIGPFVLPAGMACVTIAVFSTNPHLVRHGKVVFATFVVAALGPWLLEVLGVLAPSYSIVDRGFLIFSSSLAVNPVPGQLAIAGYVVAVLGVMAMLTFRVSRSNQDARTALELQAWHLRQLMPNDRASRSSVPPPAR
jgi:serine/threonine-protein kinase